MTPAELILYGFAGVVFFVVFIVLYLKGKILVEHKKMGGFDILDYSEPSELVAHIRFPHFHIYDYLTMRRRTDAGTIYFEEDPEKPVPGVVFSGEGQNTLPDFPDDPNCRYFTCYLTPEGDVKVPPMLGMGYQQEQAIQKNLDWLIQDNHVLRAELDEMRKTLRQYEKERAIHSEFISKHAGKTNIYQGAYVGHTRRTPSHEEE